jgi:hypothetical protein
MKTLYTIFTVISTTFFFAGYSQPGKLQLQINILPELKELFNNQEIRIELVDSSFKNIKFSRLDSVIIDSLTGDSAFIYISTFIKNKHYEKEFSLFVSGIKITKNKTACARITFPKDCEFNRHSLSKICPKCNKEDKVIPILYGLRIPVFDENGNLVEKDPEKYHPGGCIVTDCDPTWYCERNKLSF